jgi:4-amino-4-deoxy-L-arabinose transferase-like glycosyltransferase
VPGLWLLVELGLAARLVAACAVEVITSRQGTRCLFGDTDIYWQLSSALLRGEPYEVSQWGVPHLSLRAPGYPVFLAACRWLFGGGTLPIRCVQAALGAWCIVLAARLTRRVLGPVEGEEPARPWRDPAWVAAAIVAFDPFVAGFSVVLLSEAVFLPLMLLGLLGLAAAWERPGAAGLGAALGAGAAWGLAVLVKPSWALYPPLAVGAGIVLAGRGPGRRSGFLRAGLLVGLGMAVVMAPWWVRNAQVYGRFVPTALGAGASLYDGLHPGATGASDMRFLEQPTIQALDEENQDRELRRRAWAFVRSHPGRVLELAAIKAWRFWSPWPNAEAAGGGHWAVRLACALGVLPVYGLIARGAWRRRRDGPGLVLLLGPVVYFCALHMVFVSSIRYRVPAIVAAYGLAGWGARKN